MSVVIGGYLRSIDLHMSLIHVGFGLECAFHHIIIDVRLCLPMFQLLLHDSLYIFVDGESVDSIIDVCILFY